MDLSERVAFIVLWAMLERRFLFFPLADLVYTPDDVDLEYEDVRIQTSDGLIINGWFLPGSDTSVTWL